MARFWKLLALSLGLAMLGTPSLAQQAQAIGDPHPIFMGPSFIVIDIYVEHDDPQVVEHFGPWPTREEIVAFIEAAFKSKGYDVPISVRGPSVAQVPYELQENSVLRIALRLDFTTADIGQGRKLLVGSATTLFHRGGVTLISPTPNTIFGGDPDDTELAARAREAIFAQVTRSIISPLISINVH
ncbi:MAG TPA: hypothetical protein VJ790_18970 [Dongiaceae bacterium]|nr:hypothetical protein [Dongiaceae bacterium]